MRSNLDIGNDVDQEKGGGVSDQATPFSSNNKLLLVNVILNDIYTISGIF